MLPIPTKKQRIIRYFHKANKMEENQIQTVSVRVAKNWFLMLLLPFRLQLRHDSDTVICLACKFDPQSSPVEPR